MKVSFPLQNTLSLQGRFVLVTGATSGIGRDSAILLSQLGAKVALLGRRQESLQESLACLSGAGHETVLYDLNAPDELPVLLRGISERSGRLSGVVHCAGVHELRPIKSESVAHFESMMKVNVTSALMLIKAARQKSVRTERMSIVLVSSVMASLGQPGKASYCASKGALEALARAAALELAGERIRVNCVAPGLVETEMTRRYAETVGDEAFAAVRAMHPLGLGLPRDVSNVIAFLLADVSRWITGTTLVVDGGYSAQ